MPDSLPVMRAVLFDGAIKYLTDHPVPEIPPDWSLIRVLHAGICKTDLEIAKGYMGFKGIPGHEFVGVIQQSGNTGFVGKRVVGEINAPCGTCVWCKNGLGRHCPDRKVLGIQGLDGCIADYCVLPDSNLHEVPPEISGDRAVFTEPLSAACEILEQLPIKGTEQVVVLGDGRLGILCAWVLLTSVSDITLIGRHAEKLEMAEWRHLKTVLNVAGRDPGKDAKADIVVDATGAGSGMKDALSICRPRGTVVLKTTLASPAAINLSPMVINEITVVGSRCGRFEDGLQMLAAYPDMPLERLITDRYQIEHAEEAFHRSARPDAMKVLIEMA